MHRETVMVYEQRATDWRDQRPARFLARLAAFDGHVPAGAVVADLGCGAGLHLPHLPRPAVALDAARSMVRLAHDAAPDVPGVQADLEALPFRRGGLGAGWARASYLHVPSRHLPWALAELHHALGVDAPVHLTMMAGEGEGPAPDDDFPGRFFARWTAGALREVLLGGGFVVDELVPDEDAPEPWLHLLARRARTLPDFVGPDMRLLLCGLNPSLTAADAGVGFFTPGNRFWPAAISAGLVSRDRDPRHAYRHHRIGMTDLVKRATPRADAITRAEYVEGVARVARLVEWLRPDAICFVGLAGYRAAVDRKAHAGIQPGSFGGAPAYVMPSTSGLNARVPPAELADHLRAASDLARGVRS
jgi:TDG/mug DNA glycosylase family protein